MDIGRDAFTTTARLYPDSERVFKIKWYQALPTAKLLPFPSALNNLVFCLNKDEFLDTAVGQLPLAQYTQQRPDMNPLALGDHFCGSEADFGGRGQIDEMSPPVQYREDGLPVCCGEQVEGKGGLGLGGGAAVIAFEQVLVEVVSSTGTPPVHTCTELTRDEDNNVVEPSPQVIYTQVLNPDACAWPEGARVQLYPIKDNPGWFWGEPVLQFEGTDTVTLTKDPDTDKVTADVITQLSITSDVDGVKLVGDDVPSQGMFYGTAPDGDDLGYQDFDDSVTASTNNQSTVNAFINAMIGMAPLFGLVAVNIGGGALALAVDGTITSTIEEELVNSATVEVDDSAVLDVVQTVTIYENDFNAAGFIIDRTPNAPVTTRTSVVFDGSETIDVVGSAADGSITFSAIKQMSIDSDADGLRLVGDQLDPGPGYAYSTNASGDKGWYPFDGTWIENVSGVVSHIGPSSSVASINYPTLISVDGKGHVVTATGGSAPVLTISTLSGTGGPISGNVTLEGGTNVTLSVSGQVITINATGGGTVGPAPTSAPTVTATPGNTQVSLSWTTVATATSYIISRNGTQIAQQSGTTLVDTGLTNGTLYNYSVSGVFNSAAGPAGTASATPNPPPASSAVGSGSLLTANVPLPTNASGDLLYICFASTTSGALVTAPTGWTLVTSQFPNNTVVLLYERVSPGGLSTATFVMSGTSAWRSIALNVGARTHNTANSGSGGPATSITSASLTAPSGTSVLMTFFVAENVAHTVTPATPTVVTNGSIGASFLLVSAGATGGHTATISASDTWDYISAIAQ